MEFGSFEEALAVCLSAEDGSEEQDEAILFCMNHAPADLKEKFSQFLEQKRASRCGCGCGDHGTKD